MRLVALLSMLFWHTMVLARDCPSDTSCVRLPQCRDLNAVALQLNDAGNAADRRRQLLEVIKERICTDDVDSRIHVCCQPDQLGDGQEIVRGSLNRLTYHELSGDVVFLDAKTVVVRDFVYDGDAPDAFFVAGTSDDGVDPTAETAFAIPYPQQQGKAGVRTKYEDPSVPILPAFDGSKDVVLRLPEGVTTNDLRWLSVYCRQYGIDFGHVLFKQVPRTSR